jgi:hypothetical protein
MKTQREREPKPNEITKFWKDEEEKKDPTKKRQLPAVDPEIVLKLRQLAKKIETVEKEDSAEIKQFRIEAKEILHQGIKKIERVTKIPSIEENQKRIKRLLKRMPRGDLIIMPFSLNEREGLFQPQTTKDAEFWIKVRRE